MQNSRPDRARSPIVLAILALGIASCGGGGDTTETEGSATVEEGAEPTPNPDAKSTPTGSTPPPSGTRRGSEKVEIDNFAYNPDPVTIQEGGKVIWINRDPAPHTATADDGSFDTGDLQEGKLEVGDLQGSRRIHLLLRDPPDMHGTSGGARRVVSAPLPRSGRSG